MSDIYPFRCCKDKPGSLVCCVGCYSVFHHSCFKRRGNTRQIDPSKIVCSKECQKTIEDAAQKDIEINRLNGLIRELETKIHITESREEEQRKDFEKKTEALEEEIREKNRHITRLKRNTQEFTDMVCEGEQSYIQQLNEQGEQMQKLNKEIVDVLKANESLQAEAKSLNSDLERMLRDVEELNQIKQSMLVSIGTLTAENEALIIEMKATKLELFSLKSSKAEPAPNIDAPEPEPQPESISHQEVKLRTRKPQMLIIGDNNVRGCLWLSKSINGSLFDLNCQIRRGALFEGLVAEVAKFSHKLNEKDVVVLFMGRQNAIKGKRLDLKLFEDFVRTLPATLFVVTSPFTSARPILNNLIRENNLALGRICRSLGITTLDIFEEVPYGMLDNTTKLNLMKYIWEDLQGRVKATEHGSNQANQTDQDFPQQ